jgi:hypothetical protein
VGSRQRRKEVEQKTPYRERGGKQHQAGKKGSKCEETEMKRVTGMKTDGE